MATARPYPCRQALRGVPSALVLLASIALPPGSALGQAQPNRPPISVAGAAATVPVPDGYRLVILIRTTLIALNQANQTGNYSVLRDLGTPPFQAVNSDARLAEIFAALRLRRIDMSPLLFFDPQLARPAAVEGGVLRLMGLIPTKPERIVFDLGFEKFGEEWRLSAIVIDLQPEPVADAGAPPPDAKGKPDAPARTKAASKQKSEKSP